MATPDRFDRWFAREVVGDMKKATTLGVTAATEGLLEDLRAHVRGAGMGGRVANAIRLGVFPGKRDYRGRTGREFSFRTAGTIFYPSPKTRPSGALEIFMAMSEGMTIRGQNRKYLAIPLKTVPRKAGRGARPRMTPDEVAAFHGQDALKVRPGAKAGTFVLYLEFDKAKRPARTASGRRSKAANPRGRVDYFILVPMVRMPRKLDFDAVAARWANRVGELIEAAKG